MCKVKIKEIISISKEEILEKYQDMDKDFSNIIEKLYAGDYASFEMNNIIKEHKNDYSKLKYLKGKTGCYMFLCDDGIPIYIGIGGKEVGGCDLYERITQQCGGVSDTGANLSKNIQDIDRLFVKKEKKKEITPEYSTNKKKTFYLIPIVVGDVTEEEDVEKAKALETILIALFHPKYNK
ncbi:hypothetical protein J5690_10620 [bacterium]|nr:hypothetical protein [bacterium]